MTCNQCGMCCKAITLPFSKKQLKKSAKKGSDAGFIVKHWIRITDSEAFNINPRLAEIKAKALRSGKNYYFYKCTAYDERTKLCKKHDKRPEVCSGYPFYRNQALPKDYFFYVEDCGYNINQNIGS